MQACGRGRSHSFVGLSAQITVQGGDEDMDEGDEPVADGAQGGDDDMMNADETPPEQPEPEPTLAAPSAL
eukprot:COSAG01_NODE_54069_length_334_cov_1.668085_1_plen_69_part_01